jgi:SH3 domain-containing YSC84-like protein 1
MNVKRINLASIGAVISALILFVTFAIAANAAAESDAAEAQRIIDNARVTLDSFMADKNYTWLHQNLQDARGVLIFPQVLKAGYFLGGSGGTGVLLVKKHKGGNWSEPAFYTMGSVTFGLQIGAEAAEVIMLVTSKKAIDSLYASSVKLGGDASIALGPVGAGAESTVTADFISFTKAKGIYAGLNLEGSVLAVRDKLNEGYYGRAVSPVNIIVQEKVSNQGSKALRAALKKDVQ